MPDNPSPEQPDVFAVPLPEAQRRLGNKSRSGTYFELARGRLEGFKDGKRLLITVRSIDRYNADLPRAKFKPPPPRRARGQAPDRKRQKK